MSTHTLLSNLWFCISIFCKLFTSHYPVNISYIRVNTCYLCFERLPKRNRNEIKKTKSTVLFLSATIIPKSVFKETYINYLCCRVFYSVTAVFAKCVEFILTVHVQLSKSHQRLRVTALWRYSCERQCLLKVSIICRNTSNGSKQYFCQKRLCWGACAIIYICLSIYNLSA